MTAPFDRRRNAGPESSRPLVYAPSAPSPSLNNGHPAEAGPSRPRAPAQAPPDPSHTCKSAHTARVVQVCRSFSQLGANADGLAVLKTGLITQANGSGYIEVGRIKIACAVYGPRPRPPPFSALGSLSLELKFAPFASVPRRAPLRDTEPLPLSTILTHALVPAVQLHLLPKSAVDVFLVVLESDPSSEPLGPNDEDDGAEQDGEGGATGRLLAAATTVASAALADAGVPMTGLAVGSVGRIPAVSTSTGNPSINASPHAPGGHVQVSALPALGRVAGLWMTGQGGVDEVARAIEDAVQSARGVHAELGRALVEGFVEREAAVIA